MGAVKDFIVHHYRHFNAAALIDAAKGWESHLQKGGKILLTMAGAMSTAEMGLVIAELIRDRIIRRLDASAIAIADLERLKTLLT